MSRNLRNFSEKNAQFSEKDRANEYIDDLVNVHRFPEICCLALAMLPFLGSVLFGEISTNVFLLFR